MKDISKFKWTFRGKNFKSIFPLANESTFGGLSNFLL